MTNLNENKVTILGINGHFGHHAAIAFADAGWEVVGFGRSNKNPIEGVRFIQGDAENVADMRAAIGDSAVVVNGLNLPYDKWDKGRKEMQTARVIEAAEVPGRTLMYPGNVYNYAASDRRITPEMAQHPETPRGAIRVRCEQMLADAAARGEMQVLILRAGDFYGPDCTNDWFDLGILREADKGKVAFPGAPDTAHAWAYLPDFGAAFVKVATLSDTLAPFETFHFAGHFVTNRALFAAIEKAVQMPVTLVPFPWMLFRTIGLVSGVMREIVKMRYLWEHPMELVDPRLGAILGPDFGTPFEAAVAEVVRPFFSAQGKAAA